MILANAVGQPPDSPKDTYDFENLALFLHDVLPGVGQTADGICSEAGGEISRRTASARWETTDCSNRNVPPDLIAHKCRLARTPAR